MILGILADSHDNVPAVRTIAGWFGEQGVEAVLHAGDFVAPFSLPPLAELGVPVHGVLGNNDGVRACEGDPPFMTREPSALR